MRSAVLFLVFNRPETTREVFAAIRAARPPRLYVAADGARPHKEGEQARCDEVRRIATAVDWPCEVKTLFREQNLGCKLGPATGISWFFEHEEEGIILEDDILPVPTFFRFCDEMLEYYRDEPRVGMIAGNNSVAGRLQVPESYLFSRYPFIWGWATWRQSWARYDIDMQGWPAWRDAGGLKRISNGNRTFERFWRLAFDRTYAGQIKDAWDYQWTFTNWKADTVTVVPRYNLIANIGFGEGATHTRGDIPEYLLEARPQDLEFPLVHPAAVVINHELDAIQQQVVFRTDLVWWIKSFLDSVPGLRLLYRQLKYRLK